jgi:hypothetical protein
MILNAFRASLLLLLPLQAGSGPQTDDCPAVDPKPVKAQPYDFTYDSWVRANQSGMDYTFGRCVDSKNGLDVFIDWKKAGVMGFARPGSPCLYEFPALKPDLVMTDPADLWYGARPDKINAPFRAVDVKSQSKVSVDPAASPAKKSPPLKSRVKTNIPRKPARVAAQAEGFTRVDLNFISTVESKGDDYVYSFVCEPRTPHEAAWPIRLRWMAGTINLAQRLNQEQAMMIELPRDPREPKEWRAQLRGKPEYRIAHIEFLEDQGKQVVASAPVAVYLPAEGVR